MLTKNIILQHRNRGAIVIEPFNDDQLQANSYDIRIGKYIARINDQGHWNTALLKKEIPKDLYTIENCEDTLHNGIILVRAKEKILCHTEEFLGTTAGSVPCLATKSTIARLGIDICGSAGFGDVGYVNRWTMELKNDTPNDILIPVGTKIGQAYFSPVQDDAETLYLYSGSYVNKADEYTYEEMLANWKPEDMLPVIKHDERIHGRG